MTAKPTRLDGLEAKQLHESKPKIVKKRKYISNDEGTDTSDFLMDNADKLGDCLFLFLFKKFTILASGDSIYSSMFQTKQKAIAIRKTKKFGCC